MLQANNQSCESVRARLVVDEDDELAIELLRQEGNIVPAVEVIKISHIAPENLRYPYFCGICSSTLSVKEALAKPFRFHNEKK